MDSFSKSLRRRILSSRLSSLICLFALVSCILLLLNSYLPELPASSSFDGSNRLLNPGSRLERSHLGNLGEMMVAMLPDDLAFTVFVPSEEALGNVLRLHANDSLAKQNVNDTFAVLSRVMGFSTVPQHLPSRAVPLHGEIAFESVSGYRLSAWKASDGTLVVNNIHSKQADIKRGEIIVHIMDGVIMDAEFEQSFIPDYEEYR